MWPEVAVGDAALVTCIQELRKALGDDARRPRYIETLHRRGYRFIGKIGAWPKSRDCRSVAALPLPDRPSIAVLPFDNMSGDPDQEYFADGMSEDLITGLARIRWLFVIARNSTFVYKNRAVDVKQVARELGVRYVLEGSVRRAGNAAAHQRAAHRRDYRRPSLGRTLRPRARRHLRRAGRDHPQRRRRDRAAPAGRGGRSRAVALRGRSRRLGTGRAGANAFLAHDPGGLRRLRSRRSHRAVEAYPDYAPARSLLGFCLVFAAHMGWTDRERDLIPGREHAARAIALDDRDPWGHIALGYWALMERRTEESHRGVSAGGRSQSEFRSRACPSQPRPCFCGTGPRGHRACAGGDQAQSA